MSAITQNTTIFPSNVNSGSTVYNSITILKNQLKPKFGSSTNPIYFNANSGQTITSEAISNSQQALEQIIENINNAVSSSQIDTYFFQLIDNDGYSGKTISASDMNYLYDDTKISAHGTGNSADNPKILDNGSIRYVNNNACLHYSSSTAYYTSHYTPSVNSHYTASNGGQHYTTHGSGYYTSHYTPSVNSHYTATNGGQHYTSSSGHYTISGSGHYKASTNYYTSGTTFYSWTGNHYTSGMGHYAEGEHYSASAFISPHYATHNPGGGGGGGGGYSVNYTFANGHTCDY